MPPGRSTRKKSKDAGQTPAPDDVTRLRRRVKRLERQLGELRAELQEQRQVGIKVAELSDLTTALIGAAARGQDAFDRALAEYSDQLR